MNRKCCRRHTTIQKPLTKLPSLFQISKSTDSYGYDLFLDDRVGDIFADNEVFRVIKGASIRESLPRGYVSDRESSLQPVARNTRKRSPRSSNIAESSRDGKRQRVQGPDVPLPSLEVDQDGSAGDVEHDEDGIIPDSQEKSTVHFSSNFTRAPPKTRSSRRLQHTRTNLSPILGEDEEDEEDAAAAAQPPDVTMTDGAPHEEVEPAADTTAHLATASTVAEQAALTSPVAAVKKRGRPKKTQLTAEAPSIIPAANTPSKAIATPKATPVLPPSFASTKQTSVVPTSTPVSKATATSSAATPSRGGDETPSKGRISAAREQRLAAIKAKQSRSSQKNAETEQLAAGKHEQLKRATIAAAAAAKAKEEEDLKKAAEEAERLEGEAAAALARKAANEGEARRKAAAAEAKKAAKEEEARQKEAEKEKRKAEAAAKKAEADAKRLAVAAEKAAKKTASQEQREAEKRGAKDSTAASSSTVSYDLPAGDRPSRESTKTTSSSSASKSSKTPIPATVSGASGTVEGQAPSSPSARRVSFVKPPVPALQKVADKVSESSTPKPAEQFKPIKPSSVSKSTASAEPSAAKAVAKVSGPKTRADESSDESSSESSSASSSRSQRDSRSPVRFVNAVQNAANGSSRPGSSHSHQKQDDTSESSSSESESDDEDDDLDANKTPVAGMKKVVAKTLSDEKKTPVPAPKIAKPAMSPPKSTPKSVGPSAAVTQTNGSVMAPPSSTNKVSTTPIPKPTPTLARPVGMKHMPSLKNRAAEAIKTREEQLAMITKKAQDKMKAAQDEKIAKTSRAVSEEEESESESSSSSGSASGSSSSEDSDGDVNMANTPVRPGPGGKTVPATANKAVRKTKSLGLGKIGKRLSLGNNLR